MPVSKVKKYTKSGAGELTDDQLYYLASGWCLDGMPEERWMVDYRSMPFPSWEDLEKAYKKHKAEVQAKVEEQRSWAKKLRAWAWWEYEAPEPRRQLSGPKPLKENFLIYGKPAHWETYEDSRKAVSETDYEYLKRLGLLRPGDKENEAS